MAVTPLRQASPCHTTGTVAGTYQWNASFTGDANNSAVSENNAVAEQAVVSKASPTITTTPNPTVVPEGTAAHLSDTAVLSGGFHDVRHDHVHALPGQHSGGHRDGVSDRNGAYTTPTGYSLPCNVPSSVYQWDATYNGDANNNAASDNDDPAEQVTVVSPCCNVQNVHYSVFNPTTMTTTTPSDLAGNSAQGDTVTVTFTVPAGNYDQISLVSYNAPEGFYSAGDANLQTVFQSVTQVEAPGTHTLSVTLPPNFYQVDFVCGTVITTLGPEATNPNNFYHAQDRLIDSDNGGVNPAGSGIVSITGEVYNDVNFSRKLDGSDTPIGNATVTLSGTDLYGNAISATARTNGSGIYTFTGLPFSNSSGYAVSVSPPSGDVAGAATVGTVSGSYDGTAITGPEGVDGIVMASASQTTGTGYNLGLITSSDLAGGLGSIVVLSPSACGALTVSGTAKVSVPGAIVVDSSSSAAISGSGTASLSASIIDVDGGYQKASHETFTPAPSTAAGSLADPLAALAAPSSSGLTSYGSVNLTSGSRTISPGIYTSINVSNSASLTINAGIYFIKGGGFSVSGSASVSGSGVMIYNAGSSCPSPGGSYGSINWSSTGTFKLSAPTSGTYAGILIFQSRDNAQTLSLSENGSASSAITGTIYATAAQLVDSGTTPITGSLIVNLLAVNTGATALDLDNPADGVAFGPAQVLSAYGMNTLGLDGTGETIAIVDAYDDPDIFQAVDAFDNQFGITASGPTLFNQYGPASSFLTVLNQNGQSTPLPATDPSGPGTDNWEVEESLDVEWVHAAAPGAQIILVEANSQSLEDLMSTAATAASQPGVSVVSMSWGFAEGQAVFAADEAAYDSTFNVPGVTFVAGTGDYGAADPEYPAFSPNVLAVGGTSLNLNADGSYNSETGWGYNSSSAGEFIGSGGGISLYEPEPVYQQGVQSTGNRTTPDVSLIADPATGGWIADPYNLGGDNPFEVVGGTSLSTPVWASLVALVDEGRAAAGEPALDSLSPTETQQALYSLPQSDFNVITSGANGYTANAGYNLVTGLGTPIAGLLVPDLVAYQGPGTTYAGPTVGALQDATLTNTGSDGSGSATYFSIFSALTLSSGGLGYGHAPGATATSNPGAGGNETQDFAPNHSFLAPAATFNSITQPAPGPGSQPSFIQTQGAPTNFSSSAPISMSTAPGATFSTVPASHNAASSTPQAAATSPADYVSPAGSPAIDQVVLDEAISSVPPTGRISDAALHDLAADSVLWSSQPGNGIIAIRLLRNERRTREPVNADPLAPTNQPLPTADFGAGLAVLGMAAGLWRAAQCSRTAESASPAARFPAGNQSSPVSRAAWNRPRPQDGGPGRGVVRSVFRRQSSCITGIRA